MAGETPGLKKIAKGAGPKVFKCPSCEAGVVIRAQGLTVSVACGSCGSVIDATNENYKIISEVAKKRKIEPVIPLGQRGKLHGTLWEVIGFMQRSDGSGAYVWSEYLLFNPLKGFRWLTEFDGHWNFVVQTHEKPKIDSADSLVGKSKVAAKVFGKSYLLFNKGKAKVTYVLGEFYWRVQVGDMVKVEDYVAPPEILSSEISEEEVIWSIGEYEPAESVQAAFQVVSMPEATGVAPNQPSTIAAFTPEIGKYWGIFIAVLLGFQFLTVLLAKNEQAHYGRFVYRPNDPEKQKVTPPFELKYGVKNVEVQLRSGVSNSWLEIEADLINDRTGETFEFEHGVEYYFGRDSDGAWSEGGQIGNRVLSSIPEGTYHLNIQASGPGDNAWNTNAAPNAVGNAPGDAAVPPGLDYSIVVMRDTVIWGNLIWALVLVSFLPVLILWRSRSFEVSRWSTSDFSPYWSESDDD